MRESLRLPDGRILSLEKAQDVLSDYKRRCPAVIDLFDLTSEGAHDEIKEIDLLSLTAMNAFGRQDSMIPITSAWLGRDAIRASVSKVTCTVLEDLSTEQFAREASPLCAAIAFIHSIDGFGPASTAKLLHRLRPSLMPIWDSRIGKKWYPANYTQSSWQPWLTKVHSEVSDPQNLACLRAMQSGLSDRISIVRIWDMVLWELTHE